MYLSRPASKRAVKLEEVEVALVIEDMEMRATTVRSCGQKVEGKEGNFSGRTCVTAGNQINQTQPEAFRPFKSFLGQGTPNRCESMSYFCRHCFVSCRLGHWKCTCLCSWSGVVGCTCRKRKCGSAYTAITSEQSYKPDKIGSYGALPFETLRRIV